MPIGRIILALVPSRCQPAVCVSTHEDVDIHDLFRAFEAFALAAEFSPESYRRGLALALEEADAAGRPCDRQ